MTTLRPEGVITSSFGARARTWRGSVAIAVLVLLVLALLALANSGKRTGYLDPEAVDGTGSRALARLLADQGVTLISVSTAQAASAAVRTGGATLLVTPTYPLSTEMESELLAATPAALVLLAPDASTLTDLAPTVSPQDKAPPESAMQPSCPAPVAVAAGSIVMTGQTYRAKDVGTILCYHGDSSPFASLALVSATGTRPTTTVLGDPSLLTNDRLGEPGVASLTTGLLGSQPRLVWWRPTAADPLAFPADNRPQITDLTPPWVSWAALQLLIAAAVTAYVRGRRMGRIVVEPLPSVVRASEATEGLGRLYRRGGARGRAAVALATATSARLRTRLRLSRTTPTAELVAAVADRTSWTITDVSALLDPAPPTSDAELVRLADALDSLERQVRRP